MTAVLIDWHKEPPGVALEMVQPDDIDWRKEPPGFALEILQPDDIEPTIFAASGNYNRDRALMARAMDLDYIEVRMKTVWFRWAPEEAEERWRRDRCKCEGAHDAIEDCVTTEPAKSLQDFWDEGGFYCPWVECESSSPGAVKFRRGVYG